MVEPVEVINRRLEENYGCFVNGKVKFRLVWSPEQIEKRKGKYEDWYGGDTSGRGSIFIRERVEIRDVQKYNYLPPCWILEVFVPYHNPELVDSLLVGGGYEPLFVFLDKNNSYLEPVWDIIAICCEIIIKGPTVQNAKEVMSKYWDKQDKKLQKEIAYNEAVLEDAMSAPLFASKNSVGFAGEKKDGISSEGNLAHIITEK